MKYHIDTISYEDTKNCFQSLDFFARKINKIIEKMIQDLGSNHRWMVYDVQTKVLEIQKINKEHWFLLGDKMTFEAQKQNLLDAVNEFCEEIEKYVELKSWVNQNT